MFTIQWLVCSIDYLYEKCITDVCLPQIEITVDLHHWKTAVDLLRDEEERNKPPVEEEPEVWLGNNTRALLSCAQHWLTWYEADHAIVTVYLWYVTITKLYVCIISWQVFYVLECGPQFSVKLMYYLKLYVNLKFWQKKTEKVEKKICF